MNGKAITKSKRKKEIMRKVIYKRRIIIYNSMNNLNKFKISKKLWRK